MARRSIAARADVYRVCKAGTGQSFDDYAAAAEVAEASAPQRTEENKVNNCGTCKHWGNAKGRIFPGNLSGYGDQKRCLRVADSADFSNSVLENEPAYTEDGSGYFSALMTKPDFGCVLWEPKQ